MERVLRVCDLGSIGYGEALDLQEELFALRVKGQIPDTLLLLEHDHVFTMGRNADEKNLLEVGGVDVEKTGRGGDVTYHGPGQIVGYPIISLKESGIGVSDYVTILEQVLIEVLAGYGLNPVRDPRNRGVWIGNSKIAAIGLRVRKHVSIHGFALNVAPDLSMYQRIVPCGVAGAGVTSMQKESCGAGIAEVKERLAAEFVSTLKYDGREDVEREEITKA